MSWVTSRPGGGGGGSSDISSVPPDLDEITDEEFLKHLWQKAEDFSDRRRIRARMYKLREKRLREMVQNDEESLGALTMTDEGDTSYQTETHTSQTQATERKSSVEIKLDYKGKTSLSDSSSRIGQLSMKGVGSRNDDDIIDGRIKEVSKGRGARYQQIINKYDDQNVESSSTSRSNYSVQSNALTGDSYQSMKHKEVRDSVSPIRGAFDRRLIGEESETTFTSDEEVAIKSENESISSRNTSRDDRSVKSTSSRKVTERKISKDLNLGTSKRAEKSSPTSPTRRFSDDTSPSKTDAKKQTVTTGDKQLSTTTKAKSDKRTNQSSSISRLTSGRKKINEKSTKMGKEINGDYKNLNDYLNENADSDDELIKEEEEEGEDEEGHTVKMIVQTRKKKDGTQIISRRLARSMKIVEKESDIDEILVGNPDHEVLERNVEEKEEKDGSKIKIITETRRRPDGIEYTTKNVLKTSKIFDYDHPEDIAYSEHDELISSEESTETDENGITIRTVIETRRKKDGVEYTTKKVYKTSKVDATITPSDDDDILDRKETEEEQSDGTILKIIIEKRRTKDGHEYTHRQVYRSRKLTLSGIDVLKGMPSMDNDDEVIDRKEKEDLDENKTKIKIVSETRRRKDGSTYQFEYVLRSFKGTEKDIEKMSIEAASNSNINVSDEDKIIKEDVKEELQKDGSIVRTIIERRKAKDGTQYLRHRIMKIPKLPEPELVVGSLDDEVIEEDVKEKVLEDGTHCKAITERRRSSTTGVQYTLRRMSKVFHHLSHIAQTDEIIDENITEEEAGNGILVKTVIRRYERPDGSVYTTHDIQKSYKSPIAVNVDEYENDELIDRSYDERETIDGYFIKTIIETRCRSDGTHYTIERTEKVSKQGDGVEVSFKGNSISSGSPGDAVVSCEEHEEPSDDGTIVKTILEIRRRQDGTEYTNKITIKSTEVLVPEHETSYVIIKADEKNGDDECSFFPSLEDEIVYVRKKKDVDERGNPITIVIETRKSKKTGEKYNLTKKVHTTDVVMTDKGEKILAKKPQKEGTLRKRKSVDKVDIKKNNRFSPVKKDAPKTTNSITVNLVTKKATVNQATKVSPLKPTTVRKYPKSGYESEPSVSNGLKKPITRSPSGDSKLQDRSPRKSVQDTKKSESQIVKQKVSPSNSLPVTKSKIYRTPLPTKKSGKVSDSSPEHQSENESSGKERPRSESKPSSEISPKKSPVTRVSSFPSRGRSPLRSGTSTPREGTPVRQCCKKVEQASPSPKQKTYVPLVRNKSQSDDKPKCNGDFRKQPRKIPENLSKFEKSPARDSPTKSQKPKSPEKSYPTKVVPEKAPQESSKFKKPFEKKEKISAPNTLSFEKEPIISLPQTPLTEEMKAYPATPSSPFIEDVSTEPDLPYHTVHRPSLVREPSEYNPDPLNDENVDNADAPKAPNASKPKRFFDTNFDKKTSDSSPFSSSEDESKKLPSKRKDSPFKPYTPINKKTLSEERKPAPIIEKTKEDFPKSLLDQIIPSGTSEVYSDNDTNREKKIDLKNSFSARLSMFERPKSDTKENKTLYKPEKKQPQTERLVPVKEPLIVPKYIHPLGSDSESDVDKPRKISKEETDLSSTRLVMRAISSESSKNKRIEEHESSSREKEDIVTPLRERSKSPFSKDSTSLPRSKEGSPAPFVKEDSPGRFLTGKPIDQGPNTTKIKRLERSNSNKKIIYEDLEINASNLPSYLKDIEYITDVSVLEKLLQKAETYEERRIIRGHIRSLKKVDSNLGKSTSTPSYKRFVDTTPSKPSPTSSPMFSRRTTTTTTETTSSTRSAPIRKPYSKGEAKSPQVSPTEESKSFRTFSDRDRKYKMRSTDESESDRRSSVEEVRYERKSSSELIQRSEVKSSSLFDKSRDRKYSPTETSVKKSSDIYSTYKVRKESPEGRSTSDRTSSPEDVKRDRSSPTYSDRYRRLSDGLKKGRKISDDDSSRTLRDNTFRKTSRDETTRKKSHEETTRKTSTEITRKTSLEETVRKSSRDDSVRKTSRDEMVRKSSRDDAVKKTSLNDLIRKTSREETLRKTSQDENAKKVTTREEAKGKASRYDLEDNISREYTRKTSRDDTYRRTSPEGRNRMSSPETPRTIRKVSPESKTKRKTSPDSKPKAENFNEFPKDIDSKTYKRQPFEVTRKVSDDLETSVKSINISSRSDQSRESNVSKKYTRKSSAELDVSNQTSEKSTVFKKPQEKPDPKSVSRSPFLTRKQKDTTSTSTKTKDTSDSSNVYMEPLRHQRNASVTKSKVEQSNVDKIVSPYGVGPTDEYGLPLIGLKALKRRNQQPFEPEAPKPEKAEEEFVPSDAQGRPLFGIRALKKAPETTTFTTTQVAKESTAVQETLHNAFVSTETSHLQSGVISQPETHTRETSPSLVKSVDMSLRRKSSATESENENEKSVCLRDMIKLHEAKVVSETPETKEPFTTLTKPKKKLRDSFEPTPEQVTDPRPHRTWDLENDLSTRSQVMENIIAKHETLTKQETVKPAKKLNGILKKTSTCSMQTSKIVSSDSEGFESSDTLERKLSADRSVSPSKFEDVEEFSEDKTNAAERKTSYTEIKLSRPSGDGDESKPLRIVKGQKSAEVKTSETERKDKTDKREERLEYKKKSDSISKTTNRKESVSEETKKTAHKSSILEEKSLTPTRDKSPPFSKDLFKIDDRKGKVSSDGTKTIKILSTKKSEEKIVKDSKTVISSKTSAKATERRRDSDITSSKRDKKETKTKTLKDSIEKDSIDGESSSESSSDESESSSSQSSVDLKGKIKPSKPVKSHIDKKDFKQKEKVTKKSKDSEHKDTYPVPRKKSDNVASPQRKRLSKDSLSGEFSSSSSPERFATRKSDKSPDRNLRDVTVHKVNATEVSRKPSIKTRQTLTENKSLRERKISSDELTKVTTKSKAVKSLFTENKRKGSDSKPSRLTSPDRERKPLKKPQLLGTTSTNVNITTFITGKKSPKRESPNEKPNFNEHTKKPGVKRETGIKTDKVFNRRDKEIHSSGNKTEINKIEITKKVPMKTVIDKTRTNRIFSEKLDISDTSDSEIKHSPKKYDSTRRKEAKKSVIDEVKSKDYSKTENKEIALKKDRRQQSSKDYDLHRKSSPTEQPRKQSRSHIIKTKSSSDSDDIKSEEKATGKSKKLSVGKTTHIKSLSAEKEIAPKRKTLETEQLSEEEKRKKVSKDIKKDRVLRTDHENIKEDKRNLETVKVKTEKLSDEGKIKRVIKDEFTIRKDNLKTEQATIKEDKENLGAFKIKTEVLSDDEKAKIIMKDEINIRKENLRTEQVTMNEDKRNLGTEIVKTDELSSDEKIRVTKDEFTIKKENLKTQQATIKEDTRNLGDVRVITEELSDVEKIKKVTKDEFNIKKENLMTKHEANKVDQRNLETSEEKRRKSKEEEEGKILFKDKKKDSNTKRTTLLTKIDDEVKYKDSFDSSESETTHEKIKVKGKFSSDEEYDRKQKISSSSLNEDKRQTFKKETDQSLTRKITCVDIKKEPFEEKRLEKIDSQIEGKTDRKKEEKNKTNIREFTESVDKAQSKSKRPISKPGDSLGEPVSDENSGTEVNIRKSEIIDDKKDITQIVKIDKNDRSKETSLHITSEKKTKLPLEEEGKNIIKSSELDINNTKILSDKNRKHRTKEEVLISKEELTRDSNKHDKKGEIFTADVQKFSDIQSEKPVKKQTNVGNDQKKSGDSDVEMKNTSDSELSDDSKKTYEKEIEVKTKVSDVKREGKLKDVKSTEESKLFTQNKASAKVNVKTIEDKDGKGKLRKSSEALKVNRFSGKEKDTDTEVTKKARRRKSVEKNHVFCTVDGRIIDKESLPTKESPRFNPDAEIIRKKKSSSTEPLVDKSKTYRKKESKDESVNNVPRNSPASRLSKSPEPAEISRRLRKLSKQRKTSTENVQVTKERKDSDSISHSLQSLSVASTTSSVPGYMRPRRDSKSYKRQTPERDLQEVEDLLLNSYQYTRCTKRVVKPPVKYDYTYSINTNEGAAGGKDSYSIYFGPRENAPVPKSIAPETIYGDTYIKHAKGESSASSRKTSVDTVESSQKNLIENEAIQKVERKTGTITESDYLNTSSERLKDDDKYLDIKLQYENKVKAIDLKHGSSRDDSQIYSRKESDSKYNEDFENKGTFSDIRQQYEDTVRSIAEDSFRKSSFTSESKNKEFNKTDLEDTSLLKYKELASKDYKDYGIENKQQSSTVYTVTDLRNLNRKDNLGSSSTYNGQNEYGLQTEIQTKVVEDDQRSQVSRDYNIVDKEERSLLRETKEFEKQYDSSIENKSQEIYSKEYTSSGENFQTVDKTNTLKNIKFLPDYDYNKVYAPKTSKHVSDSQQVSSSVEQYSNSKTNLDKTTKTDNSTYVTIDGRTVTTSGQKDYDQGHSTSSFNKMADDKLGKVAQSDLSSSRYVQQDDNFQQERMHRKSNTSSVVLDSNRTSSTTVQSMNREAPTSADVSSRSFLDDRSKVTGINDVLTRMGASEAVDHEAKITSDDQARSLLNKFLGAQVLMTGVESMMANTSNSHAASHSSMTRGANGNVTVSRNMSGGQVTKSFKDGDIIEDRKTFSTGPQTITYNVSSSSSPKAEGADIVKGVNINEVTDDFALNQLLDSCEEYDERRRVRLRLKALMAEKKVLQKQLSGHDRSDVYSSSRRTAGVSGSKGSELQTSEGSSFNVNRGSSQVSSQKSSFSSSFSTKSYQSSRDSKNVSAFDKFKQLDSSNVNPNQSSKGPPIGQGPLFQLTTTLSRSASGVKDMILTWCQCRTRGYQGVNIENFSTSWNDGMAFCALIHHFYPDAFDFNTLNPKNRRHNFALAFRIADERAGIMPLLDVEDMVVMKKPDWKCVFTYVQSLYKRLKDE